jgi:transposase InsO family protein
LRIPRRTLAHWRACHEKNQLACRLRGRPCYESSPTEQHRVLEILETVGPHVGLPSLRELLPEIPRCELIDLQRSYRQHYRQENRIEIHRLTWTEPGRVWAMDHAEPPAPVDGDQPAIFAVRDLASGRQLAWTATSDQTVESTLPILELLFRLHGAPLVLKSDNGSAFISKETRRLLAEHDVVQLLSPPGTPSYNGSCEAGIGSLKKRTAHHAARRGDEQLWTTDDLEAAQRQANEVHRSTHNAPTAEERWTQRSQATPSERQTFCDAIDRHRNELIDSLRRKNSCTTGNAAATIERIAIRQALVELGSLTLKRRSITPLIKPNNLAKIS